MTAAAGRGQQGANTKSEQQAQSTRVGGPDNTPKRVVIESNWHLAIVTSKSDSNGGSADGGRLPMGKT